MKCNFPYCQWPREQGHFACKTHWYRMPKHAQKRAMILMCELDSGLITEQQYSRDVQKLVGELFYIHDCEKVPEHNYEHHPKF